MHYCQFRAGEIVMGVHTPEKLDVKEPYSSFLSCEENENVTVYFKYTDYISVEGTIIKETDTVVISQNDGCINFYYRVLGENEFYAYRNVYISEKNIHNIFIPEKYEGKIWTRLVFNLINFDDLASEFGAAVFHSSFIEYKGEAILFTAPCGTGKSTQASLWEKFRNAEIINGDKSMIYEKDGVMMVSGLPFSGSSDICKNKKMPVKAIVRLSQAKENKAERLTGIKAFKAVFEGCYHSIWNPDNDKSISATAEKFASFVPVVSLACLPDESAVTELENFLSRL